MLTGTVLWWCERDKNGIIRDSNGNEYYFDVSVLVDKKSNFKRNQEVEFILNNSIKDCLCAKKVK